MTNKTSSITKCVFFLSHIHRNVTDGSHGVNYSDRMMYNESMSLVSYGYVPYVLNCKSSNCSHSNVKINVLNGKTVNMKRETCKKKIDRNISQNNMCLK